MDDLKALLTCNVLCDYITGFKEKYTLWTLCAPVKEFSQPKQNQTHCFGVKEIDFGVTEIGN